MKRMADRHVKLLAAEYALGLLRGRVRERFESLRRQDARYCYPVDDWERTFGALVDALPEEAPPPRLWDRLAARLSEI